MRVYCKNHTKHIVKLCGQSAEFSMLILAVHVLMTRPYMCNRIGKYAAGHTVHTLQFM